MTHHIISKLLGQVQTKGTMIVINFSLLFISQDGMGMIDLFELQSLSKERQREVEAW